MPKSEAGGSRRGWLLALLLGAIAIVAKLRRSSTKGDQPSGGDTSADPDGADRSVVDEWGVESFPASDPPQSW